MSKLYSLPVSRIDFSLSLPSSFRASIYPSIRRRYDYSLNTTLSKIRVKTALVKIVMI